MHYAAQVSSKRHTGLSKMTTLHCTYSLSVYKRFGGGGVTVRAACGSALVWGATYYNTESKFI